MANEPVIGIDLGTTNSVVATMQNGQPVVIKNRAGSNLTPSIVAIASNGKRLVGAIAKRQAITNAENTAFAVKRLIGRKWSQPVVQEACKILSYSIAAGQHDDIRVRLAGKEYSCSEISAMVLAELKLDAEAFFGRGVQKAVVTVPAYFNDGQRQATKDAGRIAGLEVLRIINEPTAAALAYGFGKSVEGKIVVFDLGGGTFDVSVLSVGKGVFDVLGTGGDSYLGGEDFDNRVIEWLVSGFAQEHHVDLRQDKMALQRLRDAAEKAKCELSSARETQINLPFIYSPPKGGSALHLLKPLDRAKLEELTADLCERCVDICGRVLRDAGVKPEQVAEVILVGGMTRMPRIAEGVRRFFKKDPCKGVHPDEVVALGAAVQASALTAEQSNILLLDVTPQALGMAVAGGFTRAIIPKNTTVPCSATELFHTSKDYQTMVKIMVLQGESEVATQNELLGEFILSGLRQAPRGEVEIEVTFEINADGILSVSARDKETGQQQSITVTASGGLTADELQKIMDEQRDYLLEAKESGEASRRREELRRGLEELEGLVPQAKVAVAGSELGTTALRKAEQTAVSAKQALAGKDLRAIEEALEGIGRTVQVFRGILQRSGSR